MSETHLLLSGDAFLRNFLELHALLIGSCSELGGSYQNQFSTSLPSDPAEKKKGRGRKSRGRKKKRRKVAMYLA